MNDISLPDRCTKTIISSYLSGVSGTIQGLLRSVAIDCTCTMYVSEIHDDYDDDDSVNIQ